MPTGPSSIKWQNVARCKGWRSMPSNGLEAWETAGWDERVLVVDRLRESARRLLDAIP